jgi:50S ribosomal subunit-associated GTPase HflX
MMKSTLNESVRDDLNIKVIDISEDMDTATKYQVMNVPTFVKLVDGKEVARKIGSTTIETLKTL